MISVIDIQQGDRRAFEQVYHAYNERFFLYVLKQTGSRELAKETVQVSFIKLWEKRDGLSLEYPLEVQLARIVRTTLIDMLRKQVAADKAMKRFYQLTIPAATQPEPYMDKELRLQVDRIVRDLPPLCQQVYLMSREENRSYKEIAHLLSISPKSVENHISKALRAMRRLLTTVLILF